MDTNIFAQRLKEAREKEGLSLKELQARVGISLSALNNYVAGKTVPPLDVAVRLAKELHVSLDWLSGIDGSESAPITQITDCYQTACVIDQILDLYQAASIKSCNLWPDGAFDVLGIELQFQSEALYDYYQSRERLTQFRKALPEAMQAEYNQQQEVLITKLRETLLTTHRDSGIKFSARKARRN